MNPADIGVTANPVQPATAEGTTIVAKAGTIQIPTNAKQVYNGQTGTGSGSNVANQAVGWFKIPSGTASGSAITVPNTLVKAGSIIMLTAYGLNNLQEMAVTALNANTSFVVTITSSANISADTDVAYVIVN